MRRHGGPSLVIAGLLLVLLCAGGAETGPVKKVRARAKKGAAPQPPPLVLPPGPPPILNGSIPRICIINEVPFHWEVFAGFVSVLHKDFGRAMRTFPSVASKAYWELPTELVKSWGNIPELAQAPTAEPQIPCDLAILISPQYHIVRARFFIEVYAPKVVVLVVHRVNGSEIESLMGLHPNTHWVTLSPHVQHSLAATAKRHAHWMLPTATLPGLPGDCSPDMYSTCLKGFTIQGTISNNRRNYTRAFQQFGQLLNLTRSPTTGEPDSRLHLDLVGMIIHAKEVQNVLNPPQYLAGRVKIHVAVNSSAFYGLVRRSLALLPAFVEDDQYFKTKITSTIITSLVTGVPIIASRRFLETYTMFPQDCVLVPHTERETDVDIMKRLLSSTNDQLRTPRAALGRLQTELNRQALVKLMALLEPFYPSLYTEYGPGKQKKGSAAV